MLPPDSPPVTLEDFKRLGIDLELFFSKFIAHRSRGSEGPSWSGRTEPILEVLEKVRFSLIGPSALDPQTHSKKLVRSAAVNLNVRFGSFKVLSELCLAHGIAPDACMLSDRTDFKIDRELYTSNDSTNSRTDGTGGVRRGDSVCVKLLRVYSRSDRKLLAVKQVSRTTSKDTNRCLHLSEVLLRINAVETDLAPKLGFCP